MKKLLVPVLLALILSACGGGGDASPRITPSTATFPLKAAYDDYLTKSHTYSYRVSGSCPGNGSETISALTPSTFQSAPAQVQTSTLNFSWGRCTAEGPALTPVLPPGSETVVTQSYYTDGKVPLGLTIPAEGVTILWTNTSPIPETVKVGDSAVLSSGNLGAISYSVEPETDTAVIVKVIAQTPTTDGGQATMTSTYRLTAAGTLTLLNHRIVEGPISFILEAV